MLLHRYLGAAVVRGIGSILPEREDRDKSGRVFGVGSDIMDPWQMFCGLIPGKGTPKAVTPRPRAMQESRKWCQRFLRSPETRPISEKREAIPPAMAAPPRILKPVPKCHNPHRLPNPEIIAEATDTRERTGPRSVNLDNERTGLFFSSSMLRPPSFKVYQGCGRVSTPSSEVVSPLPAG